MSLKIKLLSSKAKPLHLSDRGVYDVYSAETLVVPKGSRKTIETDIAFKIPNFPFSNRENLTIPSLLSVPNLSEKWCVDVVQTLVDEKKLTVCVANHSKEHDYKVNKGDLIAHLVFQTKIVTNLLVVDDLDVEDSQVVDSQVGGVEDSQVGQVGQVGQVESGQVENGQVENGQVESGQVESGQVESGQVENGQVESGQVESGQVEETPVEEIKGIRETRLLEVLTSID